MLLNSRQGATLALTRRYPLRKGQNGPKSSPEALELRDPHLTGIDDFTPIVTKRGDGDWKPVSKMNDVISLVHKSVEPDSEVQLGTWTDKKRGWFKPADGEIQNDEVTSMHDRLGWQYSLFVPEKGIVSAYAMPEEAHLINHRGQNGVMGIPYYGEQ